MFGSNCRQCGRGTSNQRVDHAQPTWPRMTSYFHSHLNQGQGSEMLDVRSSVIDLRVNSQQYFLYKLRCIFGKKISPFILYTWGYPRRHCQGYPTVLLPEARVFPSSFLEVIKPDSPQVSGVWTTSLAASAITCYCAARLLCPVWSSFSSSSFQSL